MHQKYLAVMGNVLPNAQIALSLGGGGKRAHMCVYEAEVEVLSLGNLAIYTIPWMKWLLSCAANV